MRSSQLLLAAIMLACLGCGGQQTTTSKANGPKSQNGSSGPSEPQLPSCDDGTCFACGDGICPTGFYCESNKGVTGCASHPSCPKNPTCDCMRTTLQRDPRCKCEDRKGVAFVTCSG
ncbi:MAG: hypothetical protein HY898_28880 [Deltaproteobacteria bacterium]|nr:hypothetical protein [Deltaproteobacteria bacterium]